MCKARTSRQASKNTSENLWITVQWMKVLIKRIKEKASKKIFYNCPYVTILTILKSFGWMSEVGSWLALDSYISFYQCSIRYDVSNQKLTSPNHQTIRQDKHRPRHSPFTNICLLALSGSSQSQSSVLIFLSGCLPQDIVRYCVSSECLQRPGRGCDRGRYPPISPWVNILPNARVGEGSIISFLFLAN